MLPWDVLFLTGFVIMFLVQIEIIYNYGREDNNWSFFYFFHPLQ